jgi:hypothetical protein
MGEAKRRARAGAVYKACRIDDRLYAMNPYLTQQNFYAQQLRALALVEVIAELHLEPGHRNIVIVGAGIAGRTLAAGFAAVGASVRLVESRQQPFERYRDAIHRELHPNIIFWPAQEPVPTTALPFLNWAQASAKDVVEELIEEWEESFGHKIALSHEEVVAVRSLADAVEIDLAAGVSLNADVCVLAMGYKDERVFGTLKSPSYWSPSAIADAESTVLVSGSGDGGLIDVLSPILGTDVTRAAHKLAIALRASPLKQDIARIEAKREAARIDGTRDSSDACMFYSNTPIPPDAARDLAKLCKSQQKLAGRQITFVHESTSPYSYTSAPINKLLLGHFSAPPRAMVHFVRGSLQQVGTKHQMQCEDGTCQALDPPAGYEKIVVRHGASPGVGDILDPMQLNALQEQSNDNPEAANVEGYNRKVFQWNQAGMGKSGVRPSAMPRMLRRALGQVGRVFSIDMQVGPVEISSFQKAQPVYVKLSKKDQEKAELLKLFPLQVGPAIVQVGKLDFRRNRPDDE